MKHSFLSWLWEKENCTNFGVGDFVWIDDGIFARYKIVNTVPIGGVGKRYDTIYLENEHDHFCCNLPWLLRHIVR